MQCALRSHARPQCGNGIKFENYMRLTVLCKSNANEVRRNSSFILANFPRKVVEFLKDFS